MVRIEPSSLEELKSLKLDYLTQTTAPLDGMWLCGFLPQSDHFSFRRGDSLLGYCCINREDELLQFYLEQPDDFLARSLLERMIEGKEAPQVQGAFASTAEPTYLSRCLDAFTSFEVNALMYELNPSRRVLADQNTTWNLLPITREQLPEAMEFCLRSTEVSEDWLAGHCSNLVERAELLGCWWKDSLIGVGENRRFEEVQQGFTDLGVIVAPEHRGKGFATRILQKLIEQALEEGLEPICSTERDNLAAQKAITRAGFFSRNRIIHLVP